MLNNQMSHRSHNVIQNVSHLHSLANSVQQQSQDVSIETGSKQNISLLSGDDKKEDFDFTPIDEALDHHEGQLI